MEREMVRLLVCDELMHEPALRHAVGNCTTLCSPIPRQGVRLPNLFLCFGRRIGPTNLGSATLLHKPARSGDPPAEGVLWTLPAEALSALDASLGVPLHRVREKWGLEVRVLAFRRSPRVSGSCHDTLLYADLPDPSLSLSLSLRDSYHRRIAMA